MSFDFYKIANEIKEIPDEYIESLSYEDKIRELLKFRQYYYEYRETYSDDYLNFLDKISKEEDIENKINSIYFFKKEFLTKDYDLDGLYYLFTIMMFKYKLVIEDYSKPIDLIKERSGFYIEKIVENISTLDINLLEALSLLTYIQKCDQWTVEEIPLVYDIFDGTVDNILSKLEDNLDSKNLDLLDIFLK